MLINQTVFTLAVWLFKNRRKYGGRLPLALEDARIFVTRHWPKYNHLEIWEWIEHWKQMEVEARNVLRIYEEPPALWLA